MNMTHDQVLLEKKPKYTIIIPAYNEEKGLPCVVNRLNTVLDSDFEIIVVDDGSSDKTREIALNLNCRLIAHPHNQGKGAAMRTGIEYARGLYVIFIDADNTYPVEVIPEIFDTLKNYDIVVGRRDLSRHNHAVNRLGNWFFSKLMQFLYKSNITDPLSGLYGISKSCLEKISLQSSGFEVETELAIKAANMNLKTHQIDIDYNKRVGQSKLKPFLDGLRILRLIFSLLILYKPTHLFVVPGVLIFFLSTLAIFILHMSPISLIDLKMSYYTLILFCMLNLASVHITVFGITTKIHTIINKYSKPDITNKIFMKPKVSTILFLIGFLLFLTGIYLSILIILEWINTSSSIIEDFRKPIFASWCSILGLQIVFSSFFLSVYANDIRLNKKDNVQSVLFFHQN